MPCTDDHRCASSLRDIYCTYPLIEGSQVRTLDPERIIETLSDLYYNRKIDYVFFTDSVFNINNEFNRILAEKMINSGMKMKWGAYFSPHNLDEELLHLKDEYEANWNSYGP